MKVLQIRNFRKGFATNSSSTHSIIYRNNDEMLKDLNVFDLDYYDRCDETIAATREAKIKYIAANIMYNKGLLKMMCALFPEMKEYIPLIEKQYAQDKKSTYEDEYIFGMTNREPLFFEDNKFIEASVEYLSNVINNDDLIIVGGSDEYDEYYDTIKGHKNLNSPFVPNIYRSTDEHKYDIIKNGNYWVGYKYGGDRARFSVSNEDLIPSYPELIDLSITDMCNHSCKFCYRGSTPKGKHADLEFIKSIINGLTAVWNHKYYRRRVEFAIGGGNILLYPQLKELFKFLYEGGHIINTTLQAKDLELLSINTELYDIFDKYVSGIGISVSSEEDIEFIEKYNVLTPKQKIIHLIPEYLGVDKTIEFINDIRNIKGYNYSFILLGYKTTGRATNLSYNKFSYEDLDRLFKRLPWVNIDTTFANRYYDYIKGKFNINRTLTLKEGEFSMFIDAVSQNAYKSSYDLTKPYNLSIGEYSKQGKKWFNIEQAFNRIRKDNNLEINEE